MPLYDFRCSECGKEVEVLLRENTDAAECCDLPMIRLPSFPQLVKIKGEGGYPSRRRQIRNTTKQTHPPLEHEPNGVYF